LGKRSENAWMQDYFGAVSVASPMKADIKDDTVRITWDNDGVGRLIAHNGSVDPDEVTNPIRSVEWKHSFDYNSFDATAEVLPTPYAKQTQIGKIIRVGSPQFVNYNKYKAIENGLDLGFNVHAFTYYMGKPLTRDVEIDIPLVPFADGTIVKKEFKDPFDENKTLQTNRAKDLIVSAIKEQLDLLDKVDSQWITDQELEKNTCNHKITVKHQYDPSIEMAEKVYPFNVSKKLYQVKGEYVKASCGGENILSAWDGKKDNECLMIDNVEEEKIGGDENVTELPYDSLEFVLLRRYFSPNFFADCFPLVDVKIVIAGDGNAIKFIDNPSQVSGGVELTKFISTGYGHYSKLYSDSVFYTVNSLTELNLNIDTIWKITIPKYTGWSGIGAVQCPLDKETISYKITQDDLDLILKK